MTLFVCILYEMLAESGCFDSTMHKALGLTLGVRLDLAWSIPTNADEIPSVGQNESFWPLEFGRDLSVCACHRRPLHGPRPRRVHDLVRVVQAKPRDILYTDMIVRYA